MTRETEEGARLREALSQCGVFQEDEIKEIASELGVQSPASTPAPAIPAAEEGRGGVIRDALDKMFLATNDAPQNSSKAATKSEAPKAGRPVAVSAPLTKPKGESGRELSAILDRACFAAVDTLHFDPVDTSLVAWCRVQGKRVDLGRISAIDMEEKVREASALTGGTTARRVSFLAGPGLQTIELDILAGPRGRRFVGRGFSDLSVQSLEELGLDPEVHDELENEIACVKGGAFVFGAPPRHGVKSTLRAITKESVKHGKLVATLIPMGESKPQEGIIEIPSLCPEISGVDAVNEALRHDPEVLIAGRIMGPRQAAVIFEAALAGVRVYCAVNARSREEAFGALRMLEVEDSILQQSRLVFTSQRLVNALCLLCREPDSEGAGQLRTLGFADSELRAATIYRSVGCNRCVSGYRGKFAIMENLSHPRVSTGTGARSSTPSAKAVKARVSLSASLFRALARGRTTVSELARTMEDLDLSSCDH